MSQQSSSAPSMSRDASVLSTAPGDLPAAGKGAPSAGPARPWLLPLLALTIAAVLAISASPAFGVQTHPYTGVSFGPDGAAGTESFNGLRGVAIDQGSGDVYAYDAGAGKIYKFTAGGEPANFTSTVTNVIEGVGGGGGGAEYEIAVAPPGAPGGTAGDIYVANNGGALQVYGPSGAKLGEIEPGGETCGVATDPTGNFYAGIFPSTVSRFTPTANPPTTGDKSGEGTAEIGLCNIAADGLGNVYVANYSGGLYKLEGLADASPAKIDELANTAAIDPADDDVYADHGELVTQYDSSGALISVFGNGRLGGSYGLAVDGASGQVYVDNGVTGKVDVFGALAVIPAATTLPASLVGSTTATVKGRVNPEGVELTSCLFEYGESIAYGQTASCQESPSEIGSGASPVEVSANLSGLPPGTVIHFRLHVSNAGGSALGEDETFETVAAPVISDEMVESVTATEAELGATINPGGEPTRFRLEYGPTAAYGSVVDRQVGSDHGDHAVSVALPGLLPKTTYHWRLVAINPVGTVEGPDRTFTTFGVASGAGACPNEAFRVGASARLPDCRAYEMVSPVDKNGGDIATLPNINSFRTALNQSSIDGEKLTFSSAKSFGDAIGAPYSSQYIATRGPDGWAVENVTPPRTAGLFLGNSFYDLDVQFKAFSPDLSSALLVDDSRHPLTPEAPEGMVNVYQRDNLTGAYRPFMTSKPSIAAENFGEVGLGLFVEGESADGRHAAIAIGAALTSNAASDTNYQLYDFSGGELHLVSVLPDGTAYPGRSVLGSPGYGGDKNPTHGGAVLSHAISADGSRIFWSSLGEPGESGAIGPIYVRENPDEAQSALNGSGQCTEPAKACTIQVAGEPTQFWTASADGSKALVGNVGEVLTVFNVNTKSSTTVANSAQGVLGASENLSYIYFVSREDLAAAATAGEENLYLDHDGTISFITTLSAQDTNDGNGAGGGAFAYLSDIDQSPYKRSSRVSADGRRIVFQSNRSLTGYDNTDQATDEADIEIYTFEVGGEIVCISCNPSGARPAGKRLLEPYTVGDTSRWEAGREFQAAAWLNTAENSLYSPRVLLADGRIFFNSFDALVPQDTNGEQDVYEWEPSGIGGCSEASSAFSPRNRGCVSLISGGESAQKSEFVDASASGRDVFFETTSSFVPQDPPGLIDIYDARELGGFPLPPGSTACEGEACQAPSAPPNDQTPASATYNGPGNVRVTKHRRKRRHRRFKHHMRHHQQQRGRKHGKATDAGKHAHADQGNG